MQQNIVLISATKNYVFFNLFSILCLDLTSIYFIISLIVGIIIIIIIFIAISKVWSHVFPRMSSAAP